MALPMLPLLIGLLGGGGVSWISRNVLGTQEWLNNKFDPEIKTSPSLSVNGTVSEWFSERYYFGIHLLAPSNKDIQALDDFFEAYGYNVNLFQVPNLKVRGTFTYVKTRDAVVYSTNAQASKQMCAMLNSGTKFWVGEIGNV